MGGRKGASKEEKEEKGRKEKGEGGVTEGTDSDWHHVHSLTFNSLLKESAFAVVWYHPVVASAKQVVTAPMNA